MGVCPDTDRQEDAGILSLVYRGYNYGIQTQFNSQTGTVLIMVAAVYQERNVWLVDHKFS